MSAEHSRFALEDAARDATLPHSDEAERAVLGAILVNPDALDHARELTVASFYRKRHGAIFAAILALAEDGSTIDMVTVCAALGEELEAVGGAGYIASLTDGLPGSANAASYAAVVLERDKRRAYVHRLAEAQALASNGATMEKIEDVLRRLSELVEVVTDPPPSMLRVLDLADALEHEEEPIPWTLEGWLAQPERIILAAEPKTGKSLLALDLVLALATGTSWLGFPVLGGSKRVLYLDEENGEHLLRRRIRKLARGRGLTAAELRDMPIRYLSRNVLNLDMDEKLQTLFAEVRASRPDLIVFDSLVRFHRRDENASKEMAPFLADALDPLTQYFGASVIGLHHLRKPSGQPGQSNGNDLLHRLRGSGDLSAWPDAVWGLERGQDGTVTLSYLVGRWGEYPDALAITFQDSEDGRSLSFSAVGIEADAGNTLFEAVRDSGPIGVLRSELVKKLTAGGLKPDAADKLATRHLGRMHAKKQVRRLRDGQSTRYWTTTFAPGDAE